jgi:hypothetical protein
VLIGVRKRFIFVANTKTGSTAIQAALLDEAEIDHGLSPARKHMRLRKVLTTFDFLFDGRIATRDDFFAFGVMRDPLDWLMSWYRYRLDQNVRDPLPAGTTFAEFCAMTDDFNFRLRDGRPNLQSDFFVAEDGAVLADYIIPYHDLPDHYGTIAKAIGLPSSLPVRNRTKLRENPVLSDTLRADLVRHFAPDYQLWARLDQINAVGARKLARMAARAGVRG